MKKLLIIITALIITFTFTYPPREVKAIGVIGSNAVKSVVIGSMERGGITFANKEAKERAFDAWNMKAYEKWKADEAAGRNADLWDAWHSFEANPSAHIEPIPDKPGLGRILLDASVFGMAIGIGADIGFAIQDAQLNQTRMKYASMDYMDLEGADYSGAIGFSITPFQKSFCCGIITNMVSIHDANGKKLQELQLGHPGMMDGTFANITGFKRLEATTNQWQVSYSYRMRDYNNKLSAVQNQTLTVTTDQINISPLRHYEMIPKPEHVPNIAPNPHLEPLVVPNPAIETIPEVLPPDVPVPVIVPINPEIEPFDDGVINDPYTPPDPNPGEDPDKPPGTDPDDDPDKPPGTDPDDDPNKEPGTDPEECPKEPCEEVPPKEEEPPSKTKEELEEDSRNWGALVTTKFPFSLPWDFYAILSFLSSSPETPKWKISMNSAFYDEPIEFEINLSFLDPYMPFFRTFIVLGFALALVMSTRTLLGGAK